MTIEEFVKNATNDYPDTSITRSWLVNIFMEIHNRINCAHEFTDALVMADYILKNKNLDGYLFEFGCYQGGMSAKLSHVAKIVNKKYVIFDTFSGLPQSAIYEAYDKDRGHLGVFKDGMYASNLDNTKNNIKEFGIIDSCIFVPGLIEETIKGFNYDVVFAFIDVDIAETARTIIQSIWNRIVGYGIFTHEACLKTYMDMILDHEWWSENMKQHPPKCLSRTIDPDKSSYGFQIEYCLDFLIKNKA